MPSRKCSSESCPADNVTAHLTVNCHRCKTPIHLPCYGICKTRDDIFLTRNVVMFCDDCLEVELEQPSPKRKGTSTVFVQRTLDFQNSVMTLSSPQTPLLNDPGNGNLTTQNLIEKLKRKLEINTSTIASLKLSVDSMHETISQQKEVVGASIKLQSDDMTAIKSTLNATRNLLKSASKPSYASVTKFNARNNSLNADTPKTRKPNQPKINERKDTPSVAGKSSAVIGKPLSPSVAKPTRSKSPRKTIWISRLHRDTSEEEILSYISDNLRVPVDDRVQVRKLVKRDRDISSYSYVSFRITCPTTTFQTLLDADKWPSNCMIREFEMEPNQSTGIKLTRNNRSTDSQELDAATQKNPQNSPPEKMSWFQEENTPKVTL